MRAAIAISSYVMYSKRVNWRRPASTTVQSEDCFFRSSNGGPHFALLNLSSLGESFVVSTSKTPSMSLSTQDSFYLGRLRIILCNSHCASFGGWPSSTSLYKDCSFAVPCFFLCSRKLHVNKQVHIYTLVAKFQYITMYHYSGLCCIFFYVRHQLPVCSCDGLDRVVGARELISFCSVSGQSMTSQTRVIYQCLEFNGC